MLARGAFCALCPAILFLNVNVAEWVEMPQFSDENKIYRISPTQQFVKLRPSDTTNVYSADDQRNGSQTYHRVATYTRNEKRKEIEKINYAPVSTTPSTSFFRDEIADGFVEIGKNRTATNGIAIEDKLNNRSTKNTSDILATQSPSATHEQETLQDTYYNHTLKQDDTMFQYLPIDILKSVHRTLQSQPVSFEGKLHFLKMFEKTLMTEIESRLARTMTPDRKTRGADYYGHDDHDHSVGFPSIEGALMAISFLTFAVYLVRLVMLLFRNMNNPMPTTTAATVFLGKRKRSADLNDDAARILSNINNFDSDF
ncbi:hypothetical protein DMN91_012221 [Ooceraea biroi]|uniref:Uncharacterized protein n=1 Tax=Ooceraea biroi TaxID=2015173 RepID=A0A026VV31_OOCBI|nr:hypothetical protein X777_15371 [Ooceraea biroi]RLU15227.1 hypothetical protein DMN91_012221 [Ooceraea biroi]